MEAERQGRLTLKELPLSDEARADLAVPPRASRTRRGPGSRVCAIYLVETNLIAEVCKPKLHGALPAWLDTVADIDLHLSAITIGDIQAGIEFTREQVSAKAAEIVHWAGKMLRC